MAYTKRTWLGRQGTGLNKFSIGGATPVTIVNQPDSVTQVGDALSAGNLNDLEDRIEDAFDDVDTELDTKANEQEVTNLNNAISALQKQIDNITEAEDLLSDVDYANGENAVPANVSEYAEVSVLKGVGRVANNLGKAINSTNWIPYSTTYSSTSFADGIVTMSWKADVPDGENYRYGIRQNLNYKVYANHLYLISYEIYSSKDLRYVDESLMGSYLGPTPAPVCGANMWTKIAYVVSAPANNDTRSSLIYPTYSQSFVEGDYYRVRNYILTDLSVYFGTLDLSWIGSTYAERIATIQQKYPELLIPSDYGTSVLFPTYTAVKSDPAGKNFMDISQYGLYELVTGTSRYGLKRRLPAGTYTISGKASSGDTYTVGAIVNDSVSSVANVVDTFSHSMTLSAEGYIAIWINNSHATLDWIMLNTGSSALPWEEYMTDTLTLPSSVTLKGAGAVAEEYYPESGRVTHPIGQVDLGTLNWERIPSGSELGFYVFTAVIAGKAGGKYNLLTALYLNDDKGGGYSSLSDKGIVGRANSNIVYIRDDSYNTASAFKTAMSGVPLYYELATPSADTYIDPLPDNYIEVEPNGTIETVQSQTPKIDGAMTVTYTNKLSA